jgi:hypothetical protein
VFERVAAAPTEGATEPATPARGEGAPP